MSGVFLIRKNHSSNLWISGLPISRHYELIPKTSYNIKCNAVSKKEQYYVRWQKDKAIQTIPSVNASRDDDARSCPGTAVHASGASQSFSHPVKIILASCTCLSDKKQTTEKKTKHEKNEQTVYETRHSSR